MRTWTFRAWLWEWEWRERSNDRVRYEGLWGGYELVKRWWSNRWLEFAGDQSPRCRHTWLREGVDRYNARWPDTRRHHDGVFGKTRRGQNRCGAIIEAGYHLQSLESRWLESVVYSHSQDCWEPRLSELMDLRLLLTMTTFLASFRAKNKQTILSTWMAPQPAEQAQFDYVNACITWQHYTPSTTMHARAPRRRQHNLK